MQGPPEEVIKTMKLTFKGDKMSHGGAGGRTEEATFTLDATQQPKTLDMTPTTGPDKGKSILGIYELDGDTLKICAAKPETARPKAFKDGKEAVLLRLKREAVIALLFSRFTLARFRTVLARARPCARQIPACRPGARRFAILFAISVWPTEIEHRSARLCRGC